MGDLGKPTISLISKEKRDFGKFNFHLRLNCTFLLNMQLQKLLKIKLSPTPFVSKLRNCFHKILLVERT